MFEFLGHRIPEWDRKAIVTATPTPMTDGTAEATAAAPVGSTVGAAEPSTLTTIIETATGATIVEAATATLSAATTTAATGESGLAATA